MLLVIMVRSMLSKLRMRHKVNEPLTIRTDSLLSQTWEYKYVGACRSWTLGISSSRNNSSISPESGTEFDLER